MLFTETKLKGSFIIEVEPFSDERGWFARTFCTKEFEKINHTGEWAQINHSVTNFKGTIRGMHFQYPPYAEIKLVRCIAGNVYDVIIDLRRESPTFLQWIGQELSANNKKMIYIPAGFAHGFQTLEDDCQLIYHHTSVYTIGAEGGIRYDDKAINIEWKLPVSGISERDKNHTLINGTFTGIKL